MASGYCIGQGGQRTFPLSQKVLRDWDGITQENETDKMVTSMHTPLLRRRRLNLEGGLRERKCVNGGPRHTVLCTGQLVSVSTQLSWLWEKHWGTGKNEGSSSLDERQLVCKNVSVYAKVCWQGFYILRNAYVETFLRHYVKVLSLCILILHCSEHYTCCTHNIHI